MALTPDDVAPVLAGASPATTQAMRDLDPLRRELGSSPSDTDAATADPTR